jgi:2,5-dihydroxypyridine 5,6-dioxygenase
MQAKGIDLLGAAAQACRASNVTEDEVAVVYTDTGRSRALVEAFHSAASLAAGEVVLVETRRRTPQTEPPRSAVDAMAAADIVFDLASNSWLYTPATSRIIDSGTRMLQVLVGEDAVIARPPEAEVMRRVHAGTRVLDGARTLRVVSALGTDLEIVRGDRPTHPQAGFVDQPGMWDSLGLGMVNFSPPEDGANGTVVFNGTVHFSSHHDVILGAPIRAHMEGGRIVDVDSSTAEGRQVAEWLAEVDDPRMYTIAHVGFGLDHRARVEPGDIGAWESYLGGVILAFGANISPLLGGQNPARSHMDAVLHGADLYVDGRKVIAAGQLALDEVRDGQAVAAGAVR